MVCIKALQLYIMVSKNPEPESWNDARLSQSETENLYFMLYYY